MSRRMSTFFSMFPVIFDCRLLGNKPTRAFTPMVYISLKPLPRFTPGVFGVCTREYEPHHFGSDYHKTSI